MIIENADKLIEVQTSDHKLIQNLFMRFGAVLAGGSARALHDGMTIQKYLSKNNTADLDFYFKTHKDYQQAVRYVKRLKDDFKVRIEKSITGMCHNIYPVYHSHSTLLEPVIDNAIIPCKIQLVGCVHGSPEEIVKSFDFENLELCYYYSKGAYRKCYSPRIDKLKSTLSVKHSRSPFLMHRIHKYISYRGFSGLTHESKKHVTDWVIKAGSGYYDENTDGCPSIYVDLLNNNSVKNLIRNSDVVADEDLSLMIGKIVEDINEKRTGFTSRGYTFDTFVKVGTRDLVIEEINKRMENEDK